jgi:hypothetical protein
VTNRRNGVTEAIDAISAVPQHFSMRFVQTLVILTFVFCAPASAQMKDGDRQRLLAHFDMTENWLLS